MALQFTIYNGFYNGWLCTPPLCMPSQLYAIATACSARGGQVCMPHLCIILCIPKSCGGQAEEREGAFAVNLRLILPKSQLTYLKRHGILLNVRAFCLNLNWSERRSRQPAGFPLCYENLVGKNIKLILFFTSPKHTHSPGLYRPV